MKIWGKIYGQTEVQDMEHTKQCDVWSPCVSPLSRLCGQVPLARSETHLSELLDGVCNSMSDYALHVDPDTQQKQYMRFAPRTSGASKDFPDFKNFQFDGPDASNVLKFAVSAKVYYL